MTRMTIIRIQRDRGMVFLRVKLQSCPLWSRRRAIKYRSHS